MKCLDRYALHARNNETDRKTSQFFSRYATSSLAHQIPALAAQKKKRLHKNGTYCGTGKAKNVLNMVQKSDSGLIQRRMRTTGFSTQKLAKAVKKDSKRKCRKRKEKDGRACSFYPPFCVRGEYAPIPSFLRSFFPPAARIL